MDCCCYRDTNSLFAFSNDSRDRHPFGQSPRKPHLRAVGGEGGSMPTSPTADQWARRSRAGVSQMGHSNGPGAEPHPATVGRRGLRTQRDLRLTQASQPGLPVLGMGTTMNTDCSDETCDFYTDCPLAFVAVALHVDWSCVNSPVDS